MAIIEKEEKLSLLNALPVYKPFRYPWAYDAWLQQQRIHWLPEEVPLADDVKDWKFLAEPEKNLLTQIFRFFTQADIEVNNCYMKRYSSVFKPTEICMMLSAFSNIETVHIAAYSHLLDTIGMPEIEYQAFLKYKEMKDKYDYMQTFNMDSKKDIAITLAVFGGFTEGVQLFASFAILLNFPRFGKMKGMGQIVTWSARDETLHTDSIIRLFRAFVSENYDEVWDKELRIRLYRECINVVLHEDAFIDLAFECGDVKGLTALEVKKYIRYIADRRLVDLGLHTIFDENEDWDPEIRECVNDLLSDPSLSIRSVVEIKHDSDNPLRWMDEMLNGIEHANFFESRATEYSKAATRGTWDEAFKEWDDENINNNAKESSADKEETGRVDISINEKEMVEE